MVTASSQDPFDKNDFKESSDLKATLAFCELENLFDGLDLIVSPTLEEMLLNPDLKKELWSQLKPLKST